MQLCRNRHRAQHAKTGQVEQLIEVGCAFGPSGEDPFLLHVRTWTCGACGTVHDRDHNAAKNVKQAAGPAVTACRAQVGPEPSVPAQREEAGSHGIRSGARTA
ncbi:zinc ribbon domain-containing protein [Streptomyces sp. NPDC088350]|uniref:zinc ribbon domain-containing protein n=1 Tax=Streptomyces sp. NPDC088350 TaxID=3365854 RepID=UPI00381057CD